MTEITHAELRFAFKEWTEREPADTQQARAAHLRELLDLHEMALRSLADAERRESEAHNRYVREKDSRIKYRQRYLEAHNDRMRLRAQLAGGET